METRVEQSERKVTVHMGRHTLTTTAVSSAAASLICLLAWGGGAQPAAAAETAPTGLSVTITDGVHEVTSHTAVTYTAELANAGSEPVTATVLVRVPGFAELTAGGEFAGTDATWNVTVLPGGSQTVTAEAQIGAIPPGEVRVTTMVSVYLGEGVDVASAVPTIGSADADLIEGVTDPSTVTGSNDDDGAPVDIGVMIGTAALVLIGLAALLVTLTRRTKRRRSPRLVQGRSRARRAARDSA